MTENDSNKISFLPFHAINEFMLPDYRLDVIGQVLSNTSKLPSHMKSQLDSLTRKFIAVTGFRNSIQAPVPLRIKPTIVAFQKNPQVVSTILQAWCELAPELCQNIHALLTERGWEVLPPEADRTKLPGFMVKWKENETFETIHSAYTERYGADTHKQNDISLMAVWISGCLPYNDEG